MPRTTTAAPTTLDRDAQLLAMIDEQLIEARGALDALDAQRQPLVDTVTRLEATRAAYTGDTFGPTARRSARRPVDDATRAARREKARERRAAKRAAEAGETTA